MKRLIADDAPTHDPAEQRLRELLRAAEPYTPSPFSKRRIYHRITERRAPRLGAWSLRGLALATLLLGGTALAALGPRTLAWIERTRSAQSEPEARVSRPKSARAPLTREAVVEATPSAPAPVPSVVPSSIEGALERAPERAESSRRGRARVRLRRAERAQVGAAAEASGSAELAPTDIPAADDPAALVEAVRLLRRERDAAQAQQQLDRYLARYPRSSFTEDALALAIEAASTRRAPEARTYARRYLAQFPHGRFRALAMGALDQEL